MCKSFARKASLKGSISLMNEAAPLLRSGSWVLLDLLITVLVFTLRFPSL